LCADCAGKRPRRFNGRTEQANDSEEVSLNFDGQAAYFHKIIDEFLGHQENFEQEFREAVVSPEASSRPAEHRFRSRTFDSGSFDPGTLSEWPANGNLESGQRRCDAEVSG
jgi:hypothetical protein